MAEARLGHAGQAGQIGQPGQIVQGWIIGPQEDRRWLLGSVAASYLLIAVTVGLEVPYEVLWWVWIVGFDGPHIFSTLARTYLDRQERRDRQGLLLGSLAFFLVGPAAVGLSLALGRPAPYLIFNTVASLWAFWHVTRQHYGFLMLYKRKNQDLDPLDSRLDNALLYGGMIAPFVAFALTHTQTRPMLGLSGPPTWELAVAMGCWALVAVLVLLMAARQLWRWRAGLRINLPKLLHFAACLPLTWLLFSPGIANRISVPAVNPLITCFHNIQYTALVWYHGQRRYPQAPDRYGLAAQIMGSFAGFYALAVLFTVAYRYGLGCVFGASPGCEDTAMVGAGLRGIDVCQAFMWGFALHHYYLDQKIWRPSRDATLREELKL